MEIRITRFGSSLFTVRRAVSIGLLSFLVACSSAKKKDASHPELSELEGKKIALVAIEAEDTPRKIIEVALVNQLIQNGTFILIPKQEVEAVRKAVDQDPSDWKGIAKKAGADYALQAQVLKFDASVREGYSTREVIDTQLGEEQGTDGKTEQVFKVKALEGDVQFELKFTNLTGGNVWTGVAEAQDRVEESAHTHSIHLPPRLRFLEDLSNKAFHSFFEKYK